MSVSETQYNILNICCDKVHVVSHTLLSSLVHNKGLRLSESNDKFNSKIQYLEEQLAESKSTADALKSEIEQVTETLKSEKEQVVQALTSEKEQVVQALKSEKEQIADALKSAKEQVATLTKSLEVARAEAFEEKTKLINALVNMTQDKADLESKVEVNKQDIHELEEQKSDLESMLEDRGEDITTLEASLKACTDVSNSKTLQIGKLSDTNQDLNKALQSKTDEANESKLL